MEQQPYDFDQPEPGRSEAAPESAQYGYESRRSYSDFADVQPGSKAPQKRMSVRGTVGIVLLVVGVGLFALPFLRNFGILQALGIDLHHMAPGFPSRGFGFFELAFVGFVLIVISGWLRRSSKW
ncbi:hypothetical protein [uncultured Tessaracoccus sp.]|uniref:hypothetical protein n=1 Tax=uncultured Tessaracoccus sp. TaxID=905023 RepID=UPI002628B65A|nr:hypothetical protein [uncultured Tessaracoccus sp.]